MWLYIEIVYFLRILKIKMTIFRHWCRPLAVRHECWRFCGFVFEFDGGTSTKRWQEAVVLGQQATEYNKENRLRIERNKL